MISFFAVVIYTMSVSAAHADLGDVLCMAIHVGITGNLGRGLATMGVLTAWHRRYDGKSIVGSGSHDCCRYCCYFSAPAVATAACCQLW